jgi:hypothetical protein
MPTRVGMFAEPELQVATRKDLPSARGEAKEADSFRMPWSVASSVALGETQAIGIF